MKVQEILFIGKFFNCPQLVNTRNSLPHIRKQNPIYVYIRLQTKIMK